MNKWKSIFFYGLAIELVEELLEELMAVIITGCIAWVFTKAISTLIVFGLTQGTKIVIKRFVKILTYKEGNDKVKKVKSFFTWVWANKCTIGGIATGALFVTSGVGVIDVNTLPELNIGGFNITPVVYYVLLGILAIVCAFFPETVEKYAKRVADQKTEKEAKAIIKEAKKELIAEEKKANQTQAQAEKNQAKLDKKNAEKKAREDAENQHRALIEEQKAKLRAEQNNNQNA